MALIFIVQKTACWQIICHLGTSVNFPSLINKLDFCNPLSIILLKYLLPLILRLFLLMSSCIAYIIIVLIVQFIFGFSISQISGIQDHDIKIMIWLYLHCYSMTSNSNSPLDGDWARRFCHRLSSSKTPLSTGALCRASFCKRRASIFLVHIVGFPCTYGVFKQQGKLLNDMQTSTCTCRYLGS